MRPAASGRRPWRAILPTAFLDLFCYSIVFPFLPQEARDTFGVSTTVASLLTATYSLMQVIFVPLWGRLSDRVGRRAVLLWSTFAIAVGMTWLGLGLAFGRSILTLFAARAFAGAATANFGMVSAYVADGTTEDERAESMGVLGAAYGLGFILGPAIGGFLAGVSLFGRHGAAGCFFSAALALANVAWIAFRVREPRVRSKRRAVRAPWSFARGVSGPVGRAIAVNLVCAFALVALEQTFRYFNHDAFGMSARATGLLLLAMGVASAAAQGLLVRPLTARFSEFGVLHVTVAAQAAGFLGLLVAPRFGLVFLAAASVLLAMAVGINGVVLKSIVSRLSTPESRGEVLGTLEASGSLARTVGPGLGGSLYEALGPAGPNAVGALVTFGALALALGVGERAPKDGGESASAPPLINPPLEEREQ